MNDFDPAQLDDRRRHKFVAWRPNFDAGTLGVIITIATGIYYFGGELKETRAGLIQVKADTIAESQRNKEAISSVATDVKAVQAKVNDMSETLAVIRATQLQRTTDGKK
ncbi:MAG: hypothetical protein JWQ89_3555 [Devosia sp.]|uniref:hypothetical protein n=1 Tax=Devosia sp. TaxID=1871048 RepID=UPI0026300463|nr:hypothetical protein [Devosia sp.]MDB5541828.1 hypothetical protein [Devosia sp.]